MIANGKTASGDWNWRTFGTGNGFVADEITSGFLSSDRIQTESISSMKLDKSTQNLLNWVEGAEIRLTPTAIRNTVTETVTSEMNLEDSKMRQSVIEQTSSAIRIEFNEEFSALDDYNAWFEFTENGFKIGSKNSAGTTSSFYSMQTHTEYAFYGNETKMASFTGEGINILNGQITLGNSANKLTSTGILSLASGNILLDGQKNEVTVGKGGGTVNIGTDGTGIINLATYQVKSSTKTVSYTTAYATGSNSATADATSQFTYTTTDDSGTENSASFTITTKYEKASKVTNNAPSITNGKLLQLVNNDRGINVYADTGSNKMILAPSVSDGHLMGWSLISAANMAATNMSASSVVADSFFKSATSGDLIAMADQKWTIDKIVEILNNNDVIPSLKSKVDSAYWRAYYHSHTISASANGTVSIGGVTNVGGSGTNFNMASTQWYKDRVAAFKNAVATALQSGGWDANSTTSIQTTVRTAAGSSSVILHVNMAYAMIAYPGDSSATQVNIGLADLDLTDKLASYRNYYYE